MSDLQSEKTVRVDDLYSTSRMYDPNPLTTVKLLDKDGNLEN